MVERKIIFFLMAYLLSSYSPNLNKLIKINISIIIQMRDHIPRDRKSTPLESTTKFIFN